MVLTEFISEPIYILVSLCKEFIKRLVFEWYCLQLVNILLLIYCISFIVYIAYNILLMTQYEDNDSQLDVRVKKATERISENIHIVANEPSLAFYRLQEHVRKALPPMVEKRVEVTKLHHELQGRCYDVEYAVSAVRSIHNADASFQNIQELLRNALFFKQQLKYKESLKNKESTSVYKRLSAHITIDLPDLPELSDALRETASKVESMMAQARTASLATNDENT